MSNGVEVKIVRINKDNYHKFNDMVYWRINEVERTDKEKEEVKNTVFQEVNKQLDYEGFYVYAAEYDGKYIGWISLVYMPKIGKWHKGVIYVDELWTSPEFRRNGVAYKLMKKALELQNKTNAVKLRLYTNNKAAQRLYEKCGLSVDGEAVFMQN